MLLIIVFMWFKFSFVMFFLEVLVMVKLNVKFGVVENGVWCLVSSCIYLVGLWINVFGFVRIIGYLINNGIKRLIIKFMLW